MNKLLTTGGTLALAFLLLAAPAASAQSTTTTKQQTTVINHAEKEKVVLPKKTTMLGKPQDRVIDDQMPAPKSMEKPAPMSGTASGKTRSGGMAAEGVMVGGEMMLPSRDIVDNASLSHDHTTLVSELQLANVVSTLKGKGPYTVFAPTNAAFEKLPADQRAKLQTPAQRAQLRYILTYHVVPGELRAADLVDGQQIATMGNGTLTVIKKDGQPIMLRDDSGHTATITQADVASSNGVTHVIDGVLLPRM